MEDGIYEGRQLEGMEPQNSVRGRTDLEDFCRNEPLHGMHLINVPHLEMHRSTSYDYEPTAADQSSPPDDYPNTTCDSR